MINIYIDIFRYIPSEFKQTFINYLFTSFVKKNHIEELKMFFFMWQILLRFIWNAVLVYIVEKSFIDVDTQYI